MSQWYQSFCGQKIGFAAVFVCGIVLLASPTFAAPKDSRRFQIQKNGHDITIEIHQAAFQSEKHKLETELLGDGAGRWLIDGLPAYGVDKSVPLREIERFVVTWDGKKVPVASSLYADCFNPNLKELSFVPSEDGQAVTVEMYGSDGAGSYRVVWTISESGKHTRSITEDLLATETAKIQTEDKVEPSARMALGLYQQPGANSCMFCHGEDGNGGKLKEAANLSQPKTWKAWRAIGGDSAYTGDKAEFLWKLREATIHLVEKGSSGHNSSFKKDWFNWGDVKGGGYNSQMLGLTGSPSKEWLELFAARGVTREVAAEALWLHLQDLDQQGVINLRRLVINALPRVLHGVTPGKTKRGDLLKVMDKEGFKPLTDSGATTFFKIQKREANVNDLTVGYTNGVVQYYRFELYDNASATNKLKYPDIEPLLSKEILNQSRAAMKSEIMKHEAGRHHLVKATSSGLILTFNRTDNSLESVVVWQPGGKLP